MPLNHLVLACGSEGPGFLLALGVSKGLMMGFGAIISFSTRQVSENFNESKAMCVVVLAVPSY